MALAPTPDRTRGLFETLLVLDGVPVELGAHLDRLAASLEALFGATLPPGLAAEAADRARPFQLGRLRISIDRIETAPRVTLATEDVDPGDFFPAWERGAELQSLALPGGLGRHKCGDRRALDGVDAGMVPLLFDRGDEVLEAGRANLFAAIDGVLVTPRADGRILPGIARAGAIAAARKAGIDVAERRLTRDELLAADEVFLTGSVRGVEPARTLDGAPLPAVTELSRRVGARLRRRWMSVDAAGAARAPAVAPPPDPLAR